MAVNGADGTADPSAASSGVGTGSSNLFSNGLVDTRLMEKPGRLSQERDRWLEWRFRFENYLGCVDPKFLDEMDQVVGLTVPATIKEGPEKPAVQRRAVTLYAILASLLQGKDLSICRTERKTRNGYEVWRKITRDREPDSDSRKLAILTEVMDAKELDGATVANFEQRLLSWEELITMYVELGGTLPDDIMKAILMKKVPPELRSHITVNAASLTTYRSVRDALESYLRARNVWRTKTHGSGGDGSDPMDIGGVEQCPNCGKKGHSRQQCWKPGGGAAQPKGGKGGKSAFDGKGGKG